MLIVNQQVAICTGHVSSILLKNNILDNYINYAMSAPLIGGPCVEFVAVHVNISITQQLIPIKFP